MFPKLSALYSSFDDVNLVQIWNNRYQLCSDKNKSLIQFKVVDNAKSIESNKLIKHDFFVFTSGSFVVIYPLVLRRPCRNYTRVYLVLV